MRKILFTILTIILTIFFMSNSFGLDIKTITKKRDNNITLTKQDYLFTENLIKRNFYNNKIQLKEVRKQIKEVKLDKYWKKYIILGMLKTESNIIPIGGTKAGEYFKAKGGFIYPTLYIKCKDNKQLPIGVWKVTNNKWFDISKSFYSNYHNRRNGYFSQFIAFCEFRAYLPTQEEKNFYDNWKTSYVGAIGLFQFLPLNITKKLNLHKTYKKGDILKISWYMKAIKRFLQLDNWNLEDFKNPEDLSKCIYTKANLKCKEIRKRIYWYNHSNIYISTVLKNAVMLWKADRSGLIISPLNNLWVYKSKDNIIIKIRNTISKITQGYKLTRHRWHPAIDTSAIFYGLYGRKQLIDFVSKNDLEIIYPSNKVANCYFIGYDDNKDDNFIKRTGNTVACITKDGKYLSLFAHLKKFNEDIINKGVRLNRNHNIIAGWLNGMLNYPGKFYFSKFKNYKFKNVIKVKNVKIGDILGYMGNTGHSSGPHLHFVYVKNLGDRIQVLPYEIMKYINTFKLYH